MFIVDISDQLSVISYQLSVILKKGTNWTKKETFHNLSNYLLAPTGRD
jgi:hypothetical protein